MLVVGEAPGETEDEEGRPFIGKAGQHLRSVLSELGINLDKQAVTTNALICRPPKNATPDAKQIDHCRPNLTNTIHDVKPQVIVTLGRSALVSVMGQHWKSDMGTLERWVGWKIPLAQHWVCPTYHPSYLLRMKSELLDRLFANHLRAAFEIEDTPSQLPDFSQRVRILFDEVHVAQALSEVQQQGGWVAVDYETNCLKPELEKARIVSCAVSNGKETYSFPFIGNAVEAVSSLLQDKHVRKIAANLKFEDRWTRKILGHGVTNWGWDTMVAAHCLDNRPEITSLKFQSLVQMGVPSYNDHIEPYLKSYKGPYNRIAEIELKDLLFYGGMDALLEFHLARRQRKQMGYED